MPFADAPEVAGSGVKGAVTDSERLLGWLVFIVVTLVAVPLAVLLDS